MFQRSAVLRTDTLKTPVFETIESLWRAELAEFVSVRLAFVPDATEPLVLSSAFAVQGQMVAVQSVHLGTELEHGTKIILGGVAILLAGTIETLILGAIKTVPVLLRAIIMVFVMARDIGMPTGVLTDAGGRIDQAMGATVALIAVLAQNGPSPSVPSIGSMVFPEYKFA